MSKNFTRHELPLHCQANIVTQLIPSTCRVFSKTRVSSRRSRNHYSVSPGDKIHSSAQSVSSPQMLRGALKHHMIFDMGSPYPRVHRFSRSSSLIRSFDISEIPQANNEDLGDHLHRDIAELLAETLRRVRISHADEPDRLQQPANHCPSPKLTDPARYAAPELGPLGRCPTELIGASRIRLTTAHLISSLKFMLEC